METRCPSCGAPVPDAELSPELGLAHCPSCDEVFPIESGPSRSAPSPTEPRRRLPIDVPKGMDVYYEGEGLVLERRWFDYRAFLFAGFAVVWMVFLGNFYSHALAFGAGLGSLLLPALHLAVGLGMGWYALASFLNTTTVVARRGMLTLRHLPVPWPGSREIPTDALSQLYVRRHVRRTKNGTHITYAVHAELRTGRRTKLMGGFTKPIPAHFVERVIEDHLGIVDRPMAGEY